MDLPALLMISSVCLSSSIVPTPRSLTHSGRSSVDCALRDTDHADALSVVCNDARGYARARLRLVQRVSCGRCLRRDRQEFKSFRIPLPVNQGMQDGAAALAKDIRGHTAEFQIRILKDLLDAARSAVRSSEPTVCAYASDRATAGSAPAVRSSHGSTRAPTNPQSKSHHSRPSDARGRYGCARHWRAPIRTALRAYATPVSDKRRSLPSLRDVQLQQRRCRSWKNSSLQPPVHCLASFINRGGAKRMENKLF